MTDKEKLKITIDYIQWVLDQVEIDTRVAQNKALVAINRINNNNIGGKVFELTILTEVGKDITPIEQIIKEMATIKESECNPNKRLCYPIHNQEYADYHYYVIQMSNGEVAELAHKIEIRDDVLRYLLVRTDRRTENKYKN